MPKVHNTFVDLNFTHTRFGALAVTLLLIFLAVRVLKLPHLRLRRPAYLPYRPCQPYPPWCPSQ